MANEKHPTSSSVFHYGIACSFCLVILQTINSMKSVGVYGFKERIFQINLKQNFIPSCCIQNCFKLVRNEQLIFHCFLLLAVNLLAVVYVQVCENLQRLQRWQFSSRRSVKVVEVEIYQSTGSSGIIDSSKYRFFAS